MRARPFVVVALVVVVTAATGAARARAAVAEASAEAEAAIRRGVELRRQGKDQDALEEFRRAYAQAKSPRALAQMGLAEQALGRWVDAEADLEQAVGNKTDAWIRKNAAVLAGALDAIRHHLGSLDVIGPAGAELRVDGRVLGALPLAKPARLPIGNPTIELRQDGFFPGTRPVSIVAGELTRESVDLQPMPVVRPPPTTALPAGRSARPALAASAAGETTTAGGLSPREMTEGAGGGWRRPLAWTTAGAALLGVAGGVGALLYRNGKVGNANDLQCNIMGNGTVMPTNPDNQGRCVDLANNADRGRVAAIVSFAAAGALAITSIVLFATSPAQPPRDGHATASRWLCAPTPMSTLATASAVCQLRF